MKTWEECKAWRLRRNRIVYRVNWEPMALFLAALIATGLLDWIGEVLK